MKIGEIKALAHGVGGSYTKWQRKPPAHGVWQIETSLGKGVVQAHVEVKIGDNKPSIVLIKNNENHHSEIQFNNDNLEIIKERLLQDIIPEEDFWSFNKSDKE